MFRNKLMLLALGLGLALSACKKTSALGPQDSGSPQGQPDAGTVTPAPDGGGPENDGFPSSGKATVRFKHAERLRNDFAQTLGLDRTALCNELGLYSCTDYVHTVALGGVEPYVLGVVQPLPESTITTPIAVERVAFAGCEQRVTKDLAGGSGALIFKDLGLDANGAIPNIDAPAVGSALTELYHRALLRDPTPTEVQHLKDLYKDVAATNEPGPGRDWAILACFSVMTTMEALFY